MTASHNPGEWNGFKFFLGPDHTVLDGRDMAELQRLAQGAIGDAATPVPAIDDAHDEALGLHVERVCAIVDAERARISRVTEWQLAPLRRNAR